MTLVERLKVTWEDVNSSISGTETLEERVFLSDLADEIDEVIFMTEGWFLVELVNSDKVTVQSFRNLTRDKNLFERIKKLRIKLEKIVKKAFPTFHRMDNGIMIITIGSNGVPLGERFFKYGELIPTAAFREQDVKQQ